MKIYLPARNPRARDHVYRGELASERGAVGRQRNHCDLRRGAVASRGSLRGASFRSDEESRERARAMLNRASTKIAAAPSCHRAPGFCSGLPSRGFGAPQRVVFARPQTRQCQICTQRRQLLGQNEAAIGSGSLKRDRFLKWCFYHCDVMSNGVQCVGKELALAPPRRARSAAFDSVSKTTTRSQRFRAGKTSSRSVSFPRSLSTSESRAAKRR
ncbi:hypothetical protein MRX96_043614 [Rhipicephalus microplus]